MLASLMGLISRKHPISKYYLVVIFYISENPDLSCKITAESAYMPAIVHSIPLSALLVCLNSSELNTLFMVKANAIKTHIFD